MLPRSPEFHLRLVFDVVDRVVAAARCTRHFVAGELIPNRRMHCVALNDRCGHLVGSQALCRLADVMCICGRKIDTPARFGGDEFALVLPETGQVEANLVARRICDSLVNDGKEPRLSVSIGVAIYPKDGEKVDSLLGASDAALYSMKASTRRPNPSNGGQTAELRHKAAGR